MSSNKRSRKSIADQERQIIDGIKRYLAGQPFVIGKKSYGAQEIIDAFEELASKGEAILAARVAVTAAIKAEKDARARLASLTKAFKTIVQGAFQDTPDVLAAFGMKPRKSGKKTVAVKVEAAEKARATRKARGTLGPKQRKRITGKTRPPPVAARSGPAVVSVPPAGGEPPAPSG